MTSWHFVIVTDAIAIGVCFAVTTTNAKGIELVSVTVTVSLWDVRTSTLVYGAWSVAASAFVVRPKAVVYVVTYTVSVSVVVDDCSRSIILPRACFANSFGKDAAVVRIRSDYVVVTCGIVLTSWHFVLITYAVSVAVVVDDCSRSIILPRAGFTDPFRVDTEL